MSDESEQAPQQFDQFTPCPGCGVIGFTVQVWVGGIQMMNCGEDGCRVHEYEPKPVGSE